MTTKVQSNSSFVYPFLKQAAIVLAVGAVAGSVGFFSTRYVAKICSENESALGEILCLNSRKFFNPDNLALFTNPIIHVKELVSKIVHPITFIVSPISFAAPNCPEFASTLRKFIATHTTQEDIAYQTHLATSIYQPCCLKELRQTFASCIGEEIVFRLILQGVLLKSLNKLGSLCNRRGKVTKISGRTQPGPLSKIANVVSNQYARILITSLIFGFAHIRQSAYSSTVLHTVLSSMIYGAVYERYGLVASTTAHFAHNFFTYIDVQNWCTNEIGNILATL